MSSIENSFKQQFNRMRGSKSSKKKILVTDQRTGRKKILRISKASKPFGCSEVRKVTI